MTGYGQYWPVAEAAEVIDQRWTYAIDPSHSHVGFAARHAMVAKVRGQFTDDEGSGLV